VSDYAVIGGTGTVGRLIVGELRAAGVPVRVLSRHSPDHPVDLTTGAGLEAALTGCGVIVDASNGSPRHPELVLVEGARRTVEAAARAGASRIVCVSIVGIEQVPTRYYRAKVDQERIVQDGAVPATIVRCTQFHELVAGVLGAAARFRVSPRSRARLQPLAAADAARAVAQVSREPAPRERVSVAGPEVAEITELARAWTEHAGRRLLPVPVPLAPRIGRALVAGALTSPAPDFRGATTFASWMTAQS
jgi:uncharacterized protein YbjT (DUF2867 family)